MNFSFVVVLTVLCTLGSVYGASRPPPSPPPPSPPPSDTAVAASAFKSNCPHCEDVKTKQPATTAAKATVQNLSVVIATPIVVISCCCMCWAAAFIYRRRIYDYARGENNKPMMVVTAWFTQARDGGEWRPDGDGGAASLRLGRRCTHSRPHPSSRRTCSSTSLLAAPP
ncbi:hypothetical protein T492DRAFT_1113486 [Pavlovales sp. CCMP2436]|nr:hypothetical protein T492DRAFT_1113486 [Pavlovales sp. CCMP2436]